MDDRSRLPALSGLDPEGLLRTIAPIERFRAKQIFKWIARGAADFDGMTDLSAALRENLASRFRVRWSSVASRLDAEDGTMKLQIALDDGAKIEAVLLVDGEGRKTACLSTQVGCPMRCAFCKTGTLGFLRNLTAGEMVDQFLHLQDAAGTISNVVVMGMGEPLLNLDALSAALDVLSHPDGLGLSKRRFTVSTSGIAAGIRRLADEGPDVRLAVSLTTADPMLRERLMPVTRTDPLPELKEALAYLQSKRDKRITLEAVLLGGVNTRKADADALAEFAAGLDAIVNLIPWNPVDGLGLDGADFKEPSESEVQRFERMLAERRLPTTRRFKKGRGVSGACGQLGSTLRDEDRPLDRP
jgi:23S rRNA (adenine2503-C2)-methyltransferase